MVDAVTHLEKTIAGEVQPVTHLEHVITEHGGGGGFTPTDAQLAAMNSGITSEDVEQISTNENNILMVEQLNGAKNLYYIANGTYKSQDGTLIVTVKNGVLNAVSTSSTSKVITLGTIDLKAGTYYLMGRIGESVGYCDTRLTDMNDNVITTGADSNTQFTINNDTTVKIKFASYQTYNLGRILKPMIITKSQYDNGYTDYQPFALTNYQLTAEVKQYPINYIVNNDSVTLIAKYDNNNDLAITLQKTGGNNLFNFRYIGIIPNCSKKISANTDNISYIIDGVDDWFSPFVVGAKSNIDGDDISNQTFTGGNHQYNNTASGSTATARTTSLKFYADKIEVSNVSGGCDMFEMIWSNRVQGYNTKKSDGTGREILQENHRLIYDGNKFDVYVELIPLEDVNMVKWYGLQWKANNAYNNVRYIDGVNRAVNVVSSAASSSGNNDCCYVSSYGDTHAMLISIDKIYDLGSREMYTGTNGAFTQTYGKGYFYIIDNTDLDSDNMYSLHGSYQFMPKQ